VTGQPRGVEEVAAQIDGSTRVEKGNKRQGGTSFGGAAPEVKVMQQAAVSAQMATQTGDKFLNY